MRRRTQAALAEQREYDSMPALRLWRTLSEADSRRIGCQADCEAQATECQQVPHMVNRAVSLSFHYLCPEHATMLKTTGMLYIPTHCTLHNAPRDATGFCSACHDAGKTGYMHG